MSHGLQANSRILKGFSRAIKYLANIKPTLHKRRNSILKEKLKLRGTVH